MRVVGTQRDCMCLFSAITLTSVNVARPTASGIFIEGGCPGIVLEPVHRHSSPRRTIMNCVDPFARIGQHNAILDKNLRTAVSFDESVQDGAI